MIDLHSHILPGVDDGSSDMEMSLEMARLAVADGTKVLACTPHITPSVYENNTADIVRDMGALQAELDRNEISLKLIAGADFHVNGAMLTRLQDGSAPCLGNSSYFLFEPPHTIMPPYLLDFAKRILAAGFVPILTHPERLTWIEKHYDVICKMHEVGCMVQITAGALVGGFGSRPLYWSERMLEENRIDILASDTHHPTRRPPQMSHARDKAARIKGDDVACRLVWHNPLRILQNMSVERDEVILTNPPKKPEKRSLLSKFRR